MWVAGGFFHFLADFGIRHAQLVAVQPVLQAHIGSGEDGEHDADGDNNLQRKRDDRRSAGEGQEAEADEIGLAQPDG